MSVGFREMIQRVTSTRPTLTGIKNFEMTGSAEMTVHHSMGKSGSSPGVVPPKVSEVEVKKKIREAGLTATSKTTARLSRDEAARGGLSGKPHRFASWFG